MINKLINHYLPQLQSYDEAHANDFNYYKKKKVVLFLFHNYRVVQLLFFLVGLILLYHFLRISIDRPMDSEVKMLIFLGVFGLNTILTIRFIFRILKAIFTQSRTGYLTKFASKKG